jgi:hypothetical protein
MLYVKSRKSFEVRRIKFITLSCARKKHMTKHDFMVCQNKAHGKIHTLSCAKEKHMAKLCFAVCYIFLMCTHGKEPLSRVPVRKHTAKNRIPVVRGDSEFNT